jgi:hypothetical protein
VYDDALVKVPEIAGIYLRVGNGVKAQLDKVSSKLRGILTRENRIQTWALEEARRRLEAEGILAEPEDKP